MLSYNTIEQHTLELLRALNEQEILHDTRLVGGTSLALQYGHRNSVDLDFFGTVTAEDEDIKAVLRQIGKLKIHKESPNTKIYDIDGIKIDIVNYCYNWISDAVVEDNLRLASPQDIAAMKVNAIEGRGTKKDFIDMYALLHHYSLQEILSFYKQKYPENSEFRALLSLSYFADADGQMMPKMFIKDTWKEMKEYISQQVNAYK